jgi:hypothetical protein
VRPGRRICSSEKTSPHLSPAETHPDVSPDVFPDFPGKPVSVPQHQPRDHEDRRGLYFQCTDQFSLSDSLSEVQTYMTDYLSTKSTESLQNYYGAEDNYASLLSQLESTATTDHVRMMMKNIHSLSDSYFSTAEDTLTAKRGRNIQKYKASYDDASSLYSATLTPISTV